MKEQPMKFAFCDRGDWRIQMYMPLMQELAERGHDVVAFYARGDESKLPPDLTPFMRICASVGARPVPWGVVTDEYILITEEDFLKRMPYHRIPVRAGESLYSKEFVGGARKFVSGVAADKALRKIYASGRTPFAKPLITFGYFYMGPALDNRYPYPAGSLFVGDYVTDRKVGAYYFKNWSFTKHAVSRFTQAEARRRLGLPLHRKILSVFDDRGCKHPDQFEGTKRIIAKYKKQGYLIVLRTKGIRVDMPGVDVYISQMVTDRPIPVALEVCRASDVVYGYFYHGPSNLVRGIGVPYIMEPNTEMIYGRMGRVKCADYAKSIMLPGYITPDEPLSAFEGRSIAPKLNHTYEQFMEKVVEWKKESGR